MRIEFCVRSILKLTQIDQARNFRRHFTSKIIAMELQEFKICEILYAINGTRQCVVIEV